jgi:thioredoxin 1
MIEKLTDETFATAIKSGDVIVDFWASWCGPCKMMEPVLVDASEKMADVKFCKVNIDDFPKLASSNNIMSIPTLIFFRGGKQLGTIVGALSSQSLIKKINDFTESN